MDSSDKDGLAGYTGRHGPPITSAAGRADTTRHGASKAPSDAASAADKPRHIDVNSFADLLMKGVSSPTQTLPVSGTHPLPTFGISDTSIPRAEAENYSLEYRRGSGASGDSRISAQSSTASQSHAGPHDRHKVAPPAPRSRHGKTLAPLSRGPQVVAFDSFGAPEERDPAKSALNTPSSVAPESVRSDSIASPTNSASSASLPALQLAETPRHRRMSSESIANSVQTPISQSEFKKSAPPPVPLARRSTVTRRNRADTASSNTSQHESISELHMIKMEAPEPASRSAPPPPPSRRSGSSSTIPQITHAPSKPSHETHPPLSHLAGNRLRSASGSSFSATAPPPPPPTRRRSSKHSADPSRQSSIGTATGSGPPSQRTSTDIPRSSVDSQRWLPSDFSASGSAIEEEQRAVIPATGGFTVNKAQIDILADMDAFQREIDDLRAKSHR